MEKLIVFTANYPYGNGETFFTAELAYLSRAYKDVAIIPMNGTGATRAVPPNVVVHQPIWSTKSSKLAFFAASAMRPSVWRLFFSESLEFFARERRYHFAALATVFLFAMYRVALEDRARALVKRDGADTAAYSYWGSVAALAIPSLASNGVTCVVRYHGSDLYLEAKTLSGYFARSVRYFPWRREIEAGTRASLFVSDNGMQYFKTRWPDAGSSEKIVNRLGVRAQNIQPRRTSKAFSIVSCSTIIPVKRVQLIAAFVKELSGYLEVVWNHFGGGDLTSVGWISEDTGPSLKANIHGQTAHEKVLEFYALNPIDLFVNFSSSEGVPVSIMEALSFGIPALATDVGGTSEAVITGRSGLLISANEPSATKDLAEKVLHACGPKGAITSSQPIEVWRERFNSEINCTRLVELISNANSARMRS